MTDIKDISSGSEFAFTQVYEDFHKKLYYYFLKKSNSADTAKELVQLAFIKLWDFKHTLKQEYSLDLQLFVIAKTTLIDYLRQQASLRSKMIAAGNVYVKEQLLSQPDSSFEIANYIRLAGESLSPVRKKVFLLSRIHGLTYKEIADNLSISVKTVEDHIRKAIRQIRSIS